MARAAKAPAKPTRFSVPEQLPGATEFSEQPELYSALWLVGLVKSCSFVWRPLRDATDRRFQWGPKRGPGKWALLYLAFVLSRIPDIEPWYNTVLADQPALWKACGFRTRPAYQTVYERFVELEENADAFAEAAGALIRHARRKDPRVGAWWHVDATEAETNAAPVHDCLPGDACPSQHRARMGKVDTKTARELREAADALAPDETDAQVTVSGITAKQLDGKVWDEQRGGWRFKLGQHWWFSRDPDAGTRAYSRGKRTLRAWHGYYNGKATDHLTGGPLAVHVSPADENEWQAYPTLFEKASAAVGADPLAVAGDRGLAVSSVYEHNTLRGVASCFPYRRKNASSPLRAAPGQRWDEHGIPSCAHCGGGTDFVRFHSDGARARLWMRCSLPTTPACRNVQSISCSHDWTRLLPVWRTSEAYAAMRETHGEYERVQGHVRARYLVGPDNFSIRPKRVSMAGQQLRSNAAVLIEWLRITVRQGWLGRAGWRQASKPHAPRGMRATIAARRAQLGRSGGGTPTPTPQAQSPP